MAFSFYERARVQVDELPPFLEDGYLETVMRFKTNVSYNIRRTPLSARGSIEFFQAVSRTIDPVPEKIRYKLGMEYKINRSLSVELDHLFQQTSYRKKPKNNYIWVVKLCYNL